MLPRDERRCQLSVDPGIFPAAIPVNGEDKEIRHPITRLLGEDEYHAGQQL